MAAHWHPLTGHQLPTFLPGYQDSFISLPHTNVSWFSWVSLAASMAAGILFGFAGIVVGLEPRATRRLPGTDPSRGTRDLRPAQPANGVHRPS